jgi:hypothetical protein
LFDCEAFKNIMSQNKTQMKARWTQDFVEFLESQNAKKDSPVAPAE